MFHTTGISKRRYLHCQYDFALGTNPVVTRVTKWWFISWCMWTNSNTGFKMCENWTGIVTSSGKNFNFLGHHLFG